MNEDKTKAFWDKLNDDQRLVVLYWLGFDFNKSDTRNYAKKDFDFLTEYMQGKLVYYYNRNIARNP